MTCIGSQATNCMGAKVQHRSIRLLVPSLIEVQWSGGLDASGHRVSLNAFGPLPRLSDERTLYHVIGGVTSGSEFPRIVLVLLRYRFCYLLSSDLSISTSISVSTSIVREAKPQHRNPMVNSAGPTNPAAPSHPVSGSLFCTAPP